MKNGWEMTKSVFLILVSLSLLWSQKISTNNNKIQLLKIIQGEQEN